MMGTWSHDLLGSDAAADLEAELTDRMRKSKHAHRRFIQDRIEAWDRAVRRGDTDACRHVLALVALLHKHGLKLDKKLKQLTQAALKQERRKSALNQFAKPREREKVLKAFEVQLQEMPIDESKGPSRDSQSLPMLQYADDRLVKKTLAKFAEVAKSDGGMGYIFLFSPNDDGIEPPQFLKQLHNLAWTGLKEESIGVVEECLHERAMMIAWYLALMSGFELEEVNQLIERVSLWPPRKGSERGRSQSRSAR